MNQIQDNKKTIKLILAVITLFAFNNASTQTVTDYDGNVYPIITIGNQKWMAMNLRSTHFNDGSPITNAGYNNWYFAPLSIPRYCEPLIPTNTTDSLALGYWYNYPAASDIRNICPQGWHVASDADWYQMVHFLDPNSDTSSLTTLESAIAGGMLKDTSTWISPNIGATNNTGFSALAVSSINGSIVWPSGHVCCQGLNASFWCSGSTWNPGVICYDRNLDYMQANITRNTDNYSNGKSIRCVCDTLTSTTSINIFELKKKISLFPNPSTDKITLTSEEKTLGRFVIYNNLGVVIYQGSSNEKTAIVDISKLENGIYVVLFGNTGNKIPFFKSSK
ncbi:MAG: FISUMP domain-containing protein [Bacteroidota bacterium]|jgi:uncharacterized protein (TIGR02145 family)